MIELWKDFSVEEIETCCILIEVCIGVNAFF